MPRTSTVQRVSTAYLISIGWAWLKFQHKKMLYASMKAGGLMVRYQGKDFGLYAIEFKDGKMWMVCDCAGGDDNCMVEIPSINSIYRRK